jgi:CBS domain-containing protein
MSRTYSALPASGLHASVDFHKPATGELPPVTFDDDATAVMTDFRKVRALTIHGAATMERAYDKMITNGVRLLLVVDSRNHVVGLITSTDVEGEKPLRIIQDRRIRRAEILVSDVMTPRERLEVLDMDDVQFARVGHVVATLKAVGRRHALVVDSDEQGNQTVRGLFSCSQLEKQLGQDIETTEIARSFAEVGEMLGR